jgi:acetolactate synthase-1/2/3 large subunit
MPMSGAELLIKCLQNEGVEVIFGYPGGKVLEIYDILIDSGIRHILTRHEQAAAHAADGYARASGKPGVCMATSGPGATNLVTGLLNAYMDSSPVIAFTGQVPTGVLGTDSFQEADVTGITLPVVKHSYLIKDVRTLKRAVHEAFYIAPTGRPGPVLIDIPSDISIAQAEYSSKRKNCAKLPGYRPPLKGNPGHPLQIKRATQTLLKAKRPVILVGGGTILSDASSELIDLANLAHIPVTSSLMGIGGFPFSNPLWLGMAGMHGTYCANQALHNSDLILALGVRFSDRLTGDVNSFAKKATIIHVDIDPAEIGKNITADVPIVGDVKAVLVALKNQIKENEPSLSRTLRAEYLKPWLNEIAQWQLVESKCLAGGEGQNVKPKAVLNSLRSLVNDDSIVVSDVGQNQMWVAQHFGFSHPRTHITSGGLGTMGFSLPASIGAQIAKPDKTVITVCGDGGFLMNCQELATVAEYVLPIKIIVLNNGVLGMVRQWQEFFYNKKYSSISLANPDFCKVSQAFGIPATRIDKASQIQDSLVWALNTEGPCFLEVVISPGENVLPMIPPGKSIDDVIMPKGGDKDKALGRVEEISGAFEKRLGWEPS